MVAKVRSIIRQAQKQELLGVTRLDVAQGSNENRVKRTYGYVERDSKAADEAIRQEPASMAGFARQQGKVSRKIRVGHAGTLDPLATGLLVILVGSYCKRAQEFSKLDKTYEVTMKLGETSSTGDAEGEISPYVPPSIKGRQSRPLPKASGALRRQNLRSSVDVPLSTSSSGAQPFLALQPNTNGETNQSFGKKPTLEQIEAVLNSFIGDIEQTPHAFSAIKVGGQRAYKLARAGKEVKLNPRRVKVYSIRLTDYSYPEVKFICKVSSGTYIRSLVEDIGQKLDTGAYMSDLKRVQVGKFDVANATSELNFDSTLKNLLQ